jgi:hypothetical protein
MKRNDNEKLLQHSIFLRENKRLTDNRSNEILWNIAEHVNLVAERMEIRVYFDGDKLWPSRFRSMV